nr:uncharacterized protein LOC104116442 [Nicotiana tomentosiformis]
MEAREDMKLIQNDTAIKKSITSLVYKQLLPNNARVPWKYFMYRNDARPKAKIIMWLGLQGKLITTDRLIRWGMNVEGKCSLCQAQEETRDHLLAECEYSKRHWEKTMQWIQHQRCKHIQWKHHLEWAIESAKGRSPQAQIFRMAYAECLYAIWMERNYKIFEKKSRNWEAIARETTVMCHVRAAPRVQTITHSLQF